MRVFLTSVYRQQALCIVGLGTSILQYLITLIQYAIKLNSLHHKTFVFLNICCENFECVMIFYQKLCLPERNEIIRKQNELHMHLYTSWRELELSSNQKFDSTWNLQTRKAIFLFLYTNKHKNISFEFFPITCATLTGYNETHTSSSVASFNCDTLLVDQPNTDSHA